MGNLDKETANLAMDVLLEHTRETKAALLLVTHDEDMAMRCDAIYRLQVQGLQRPQ